MTGVITTVQGTSNAVAVGDRIAWTVQYDPSTAPSPGTPSGPIPVLRPGITYTPNTPLISSLTDVSNGNALYTPPAASLQSSLQLSSVFLPGTGYLNSLNATDTQIVPGVPPPMNMVYQTALFLGPGTSPSSLDLTTFRLDQAGLLSPGHVAGNSLGYFSEPVSSTGGDTLFFIAQVDSISAVATAPEPGSLGLLALGTIAVAARRLRRAPWRSGWPC